MNAFPRYFRRSKVVIAGTALTAFVQPAFPSAPVAVRPVIGKARPGRVVATRTALPAATTAATPVAEFVDLVRPGLRTPRAGCVVSTQSALPPLTTTAAAENRPDAVKAAIAPRRAAPHPVTARTWESDFQARNRSPVVVKATVRRLAALVAFTRCATPPEAVESQPSLAPHVVRPAPWRPVIGHVTTARTPLVDGTLGLPSTNPAQVRAPRQFPRVGLVRTATAARAAPGIHQTPPTDAVAVAPVQTPRRSGKITAARTATVPLPATTPSIAIRAARGPRLPARAATAVHRLVFTVQPAPAVHQVGAGRLPKRAAPAAVALRPATVPTLTAKPARIRPGVLARRAARPLALGSSAGPAPPMRAILVRRGQAKPLSAPPAIVGQTPSVRQATAPQALLARPVRIPRRSGAILLGRTALPSVAAHGPMPQVEVVAPGRWPRRISPHPVIAVSPVSWAVTGLAPDLPAAAIAWLRLNPAVVSGFGETLTATPPVFKLFGDWNSTKSPMPYLVYQEVYEGPGNYQSANAQGVVYGFPTGQFQVSIFAASKRQGRQLAELVAATLNDAPLTFADGVLLELRLDSMHAIPEGDIGPGGVVTAYHFALTFLYRVQRSLTFTT